MAFTAARALYQAKRAANQATYSLEQQYNRISSALFDSDSPSPPAANNTMQEPLLGAGQHDHQRWFSSHTHRPQKLRIWSVGSLMAVIATVLLIFAVSTTRIYHNTYEPAAGSKIDVAIGAMDLCYKASEPIEAAGCKVIDRNCQIQSDDFPSLKAKLFETQCDVYQAARALLITSIILSGLAAVVQLLATSSLYIELTPLAGLVLGYAAFASTLVTMALFWSVHNAEQQGVMKDADFGYGWWMITSSWPMLLIGTSLFLIS